MSTIKVLNMAGAEVGTVELCDSIFGIEPNQAVVHEVVKNHLANCRQGTQSALTRAEVSGGGRKPWRQKGTGHARQGSTRAPQWTHGGGEGKSPVGRPGPVTPWGKPALGYKTRKTKNRTDKFIVKRRNVK